ncbi:hypothetical protein BH20ACI1_BH20ACI1_03960 [soil metagenome]
MLWISVGFNGRTLPLGWVRVPPEGNSDLALQQELLTWLKQIVSAEKQVVIVADREFHSIHLAQWIEHESGFDYILRIKAGTYIEFDGGVMKTSGIAVCGDSFRLSGVKVTKDARLQYRTNLTVHWAEDEDEAWILATNSG